MTFAENLTTFYYSVFHDGILAALISFLICTICGQFFIKSLKVLHINQVFRTKEQVRELAQLHKSKAGVPTMGGLIISLGALTSASIFCKFNKFVVIPVIVYALGTALGVFDDLLKISRGNSKGIAAKYKLLLPACVVTLLMVIANGDATLKKILINVEWDWITLILNTKVLFVIITIFYFFVIAGTSNAVNLTDGIDGLAITNITVSFVFFAIIALGSSNHCCTNNTLLTEIDGAEQLYILCCSFAGACISFYIFNRYPASVFMGDAGSLGLGSLLAIIAILLRQPFALLSVGIIFVSEAMSVMLQVSSKKLFDRRIFLMTPIHHHFELKGFSEKKIVKSALIIQCVFTIATLIVIFYGPSFVS